MLSKAAHILCVVLALQSFSNIAKSHPVATESDDDVDIHNHTTTSHEAGVVADLKSLKSIRDVVWQMPRGIPVIKPVPHDEPEPNPSTPQNSNPDPSEPGGTNSDPSQPKDSPHNVNSDPSQPGGAGPDPSKPKDSPENSTDDPSKPKDPPATAPSPNGATACRRSSSGALHARQCTTASDPIEDDAMGEGDTDTAEDSLSVTPPDSPPRDIFTETRDGSAPQTSASALFQDRTSGTGSDVEIPEIETFDQNYKFKETDKTDVTQDSDDFDLRAQAQPILKAAGVDFARDGKHFEITSNNRAVGFLRSTYTNDGKVLFSEFAYKAEDLTPKGERLPWFKMNMHIYNKRMNLDPKQLTTIVVCKCTNKDTIATNDAAIRELTPNADGYYVLRKDAPAGSAELDAFKSWLATPNGMGPLWMTGSYYDRMGSEIKEIWTQPSLPADDEFFQRIPGTVLKLGPRS